MDESLYTRSQLMMLAPTKGHKKAHVLVAKEASYNDSLSKLYV